MSTQEKSKKTLLLEVRAKREKRRRGEKRRRFLSVIASITILVITTGVVFSVSAKEINITEIDEFKGTNETKTVYTMGGSVGEILDEHKLELGKSDRINVPVDAKITDDEDIVITRGKEITIVADGVETNAVVTKADARDALVEAGYVPSETDEISVHNGEDLKDSDKIELVSVSKTEDITIETIEFSTDYVDDPNMCEGETKVLEEGRNGEKEIKSTVTYRAGEEVSREVLSENVTLEPKNRIVAQGTKKPEKRETMPKAKSVSVSDTGGTVNGMSYSRKITMTATAYSTSPSENGGYTVSALGNPLGFGIVAVDPSVIPLGSKVYITSADGSWTYGVASAEDTGGAIKGNKIDLCYEGTTREVNRFGKRNCVVYVLN